MLFDIGALTPDMSVRLSKMLLGDEPGAKRPKPNKPRQDDPDAPRPPREDVDQAWASKGRPTVASGP